jgi:hypothetical protein
VLNYINTTPRRCMGEWMYRSMFSWLIGGEWSASCPGQFTPVERAPGTHWLGGLVGPRACLDNVEKRKTLPLPGLKLWPLGCPARAQSQSRLLYWTDYSLNLINTNNGELHSVTIRKEAAWKI